MAEHITITTQALPEAPPTVTPYQQLVAEAFAALDQILGIIPKLEEAEASGRKVASGRLGVPAAFVATVVSAVEQLPELAAAKKLDPVAARGKIQYLEAFRPLYDKLFTVTRRLNFALLYMKDSVVFDSLQVYRIAKQHASDQRSPLMAAHVANMKRALGKKVPTRAVREERKLARMMDAIAEMQETQGAQKAA
jgi:hypothetical protein